MNVTLSKRQKYLIFSALTLVPLYFFSQKLPEISVPLLIMLLLVVFIGSYIVHLPNSRPLNILVTSIMPLSLVLGFILSLIFFPNLSRIFKMMSLVGFAGIFYVIALVNNVFLVVETREELIPLYRVAVTWSKILMAAVAIPLLAGIYKISINSFVEAAATALITLLFSGYLLWVSRFNPDAKKYKVGEIVTILILGGFIVSVANLAVSFFPTETFLRALFVASILIFSVSYTEAHLKNSITKKLISEHFVLSTVFLILLFVFKP